MMIIRMIHHHETLNEVERNDPAEAVAKLAEEIVPATIKTDPHLASSANLVAEEMAVLKPTKVALHPAQTKREPAKVTGTMKTMSLLPQPARENKEMKDKVVNSNDREPVKMTGTTKTMNLTPQPAREDKDKVVNHNEAATLLP
jgi:hypothetical protein